MFKALYLENEQLLEAPTQEDVQRVFSAELPLWVQLSERDEASELLLSQVLHIHPLAVEDIWNDLQIPKVEDFDDYLQIIVHRIQDNCGIGEIRFDEVDILIGRHFVVTRAHHAHVLAHADREIRKNPKLLKKGPAFVAHAVLDRVVDEYLPYVDHYEEAIESIERDLAKAARSKHPGEFATRIFALTRALQRFRRFALQQEEVLARLARAEFDEIPKAARPFYGDVHDHFTRVTNLAEGSREVLSDMLSMYWSMQSTHMNEIMKTLTLMSTIMLPITFIAGVYGMNFEHMPELHWVAGYPSALLLMLAVAVSIVWYFRAKKWL